MLQAHLLAFLENLAIHLDESGWDRPGLLLAIHLEDGPDGPALASTGLGTLVGSTTCALLRTHLTVEAEAIGAVLVTEGWSYGPSAMERLRAGEVIPFRAAEDPDRVEVRLLELALRDGTELTVVHRRGETPNTIARETSSWNQWLLRLALELPSDADDPADDLALRLLLLWQVSNVLALRDGGYRLDPQTESESWGLGFTVPGLGSLPDASREGWWAPIEASLAGAPLSFTRLAGTVRGALEMNELALPGSFPFQDGPDAVVLDATTAAWLDDEALVRFCDDSVPSLENIAAGASQWLDGSLLDGLLACITKAGNGG